MYVYVCVCVCVCLGECAIVECSLRFYVYACVRLNVSMHVIMDISV